MGFFNDNPPPDLAEFQYLFETLYKNPLTYLKFSFFDEFKSIKTITEYYLMPATKSYCPPGQHMIISYLQTLYCTLSSLIQINPNLI